MQLHSHRRYVLISILSLVERRPDLHQLKHAQVSRSQNKACVSHFSCGSSIGQRDRSTPSSLLTDFAFNDGEDSGIGQATACPRR